MATKKEAIEYMLRGGKVRASYENGDEAPYSPPYHGLMIEG